MGQSTESGSSQIFWKRSEFSYDWDGSFRHPRETDFWWVRVRVRQFSNFYFSFLPSSRSGVVFSSGSCRDRWREVAAISGSRMMVATLSPSPRRELARTRPKMMSGWCFTGAALPGSWLGARRKLVGSIRGVSRGISFIRYIDHIAGGLGGWIESDETDRTPLQTK